MTAPVQSCQQSSAKALADFLAQQNRYHSESMCAQDPIIQAHISQIVEWEKWVRASGDVRAAVIEDRRQIALAVAKRHSEMLDELTKTPKSARIGGWVGGLAIALQIISQSPAPDAAASEEACCQPLWDAYLQAVYVINRYRHLHAGESVRDLDEAEEGLKSRQKKLDAWSGFDAGRVA